MNEQYKTSVQHSKNLERGLTVLWSRETDQPRNDDNWSVVAYSDQSRWLFDNGSAEEITLLGEVSDGLNKCEILQTPAGSVVALYSDGPQSFSDREAWVDSLSESDKPEAKALLRSV